MTKKINYDSLKFDTGYFNHKGEEVRVGDVVNQGGTKSYVTLMIDGNYWLVNLGEGAIPLSFYCVDNDNHFEIEGNILDHPKLISNCWQ